MTVRELVAEDDRAHAALHRYLLDLDRALVARAYPSDVDVVLDVTDDRCPWNAGRWRFTVEKGEAAVRRVTDEPDVALDISALGAAFLGDRDPHCPELF